MPVHRLNRPDSHLVLALLAAVPVWLGLLLWAGPWMRVPQGAWAWCSLLLVQPCLEEWVFRGLLQGEALRLSVPTVVFLDINMPGMNGFDVARALNDQLHPQAELQLNMLTSSAWSVDQATAASIGLIQHYLVKPLTAEMAAGLVMPLCASSA